MSPQLRAPWRPLALSLGSGVLAFGLLACGGSTATPRACCGPPDTVTPVTEDTLVPDDTVVPEDTLPPDTLPPEPVSEPVSDGDPYPDSDFDGIPDAEDIDVYEDSDMDGIPNDQDYSADDPILDNHENNMDATNVWTDPGSGW
jgi:hypothetical protein